MPEPLFNIEDKNLKLYTPVSMTISGLRNFCSGAVMSKFTGGRAAGIAKSLLSAPQVKKYKECTTWADWKSRYNTYSYAVPEEYAYLFWLETLYNKARHGIGGEKNDSYRMWGGVDWGTKTWFIADRMTGRSFESGLSCCSFMKFFNKTEMAQTYGRLQMSDLAPGAHGGQCAGGVWAPNLPYIKERLERGLKELNSHAEWLWETYGNKNNESKDEVARLY